MAGLKRAGSRIDKRIYVGQDRDMTKTFAADVARFDKMFTDADAIRTESDGFQWIDPTKVPAAAVAAYNRLMSFGFANGLV